MNRKEIKECAERIQILTGSYSALDEKLQEIVEIPNIQQYRVVISELKNLIAAESRHITQLLNQEE